MNLCDFPAGIRIKLPGELEEGLWRRVDEEGVSAFAGDDFSRSDIYSWKSKQLFLPAGFVHEALGDVEGEVTVKGGGNGGAVEVELPLEFSDELYTRMRSVNVNRDNVPVYRPSDSSLVDRFVALLDARGFDYSVYRRSGREVRFPSVLYRLVRASDAGLDFAALVDEEGSVEDGKLKAGGRKVAVEEFDGELYSRHKRMELAVERSDSKEIEKLIGEETGRIMRAFG